MKKIRMLLLFTLIVAGCSQNDRLQNKGDENTLNSETEQQTLSMQVLKADAEKGITLEENMYRQLTELVEANPNLGVAGDFGIHALDLVTTTDGESVMLFLGINRLQKPIKNITFDYSLGLKNGGEVDYVFDKEKVDLSEPFAGTIQPNHAIPFTIPVSAEGQVILQLLTEENKMVKLENADFVLVD